MKINNLTAKTSLEIQDTDIMVIQDDTDTKQVSVADLREYLNSTAYDKNTKKIINNTIDNIIVALESAKYIVSDLRSYMINTWIGSTSGNIQIALKDIQADKWLTADEIIALMELQDDGITYKYNFTIKAKMDDDTYVTAVSYTVRDFNTEHPSGTNQALENSNAGFIKAHFDGLTQNEIAGITYDDIYVEFPESEEYRYEFNPDAGSFANAVPYVTTI